MTALLEQAVQHHQAGRFDEAERLYREVLRAAPNTADAWQFLGLIALSRNDAPTALELIRRAIALNPDVAVYHFNLGVALRNQGDVAGAIASYRHAVKLSPGLAEAHNNLGNCLRDSGDPEGAAAAFRSLIALRPTSCEAHVNLSKALLDLGRLDAAEQTARRALSLDGHRALAQFQLANVLQLRGRYAEAEPAYRSVLRDDPKIEGVHVNLGNALVAMRQYEAACIQYQCALRTNAEDVQAHFGLIRALLHLGRYDDAMAAVEAAPPGGSGEARDFAEIFVRIGVEVQQRGHTQEAVTWFEKALARDAELAPTHFNLGLARQQQGRLTEAAACYKTALKLDPRYMEPRKNLAILQLLLGYPGDAIATYREGVTVRPDVSDFQRCLVAATCYDPGWSNDARYAEARRFAEVYGRRQPGPAPYGNSRDPARRLRIGYFSSDLREHPIGRNIEPLLLYRDKAQYEVFAYSEVRKPDDMTAHLRTLTDVWRSTVGQTDEDVAAQMRSDELDILVLLAGHLDDNRPSVCAFRPAPIQLSFHDVTTSALDCVDYLIGDRVVCPSSGGERFTERVIRLPSIYAHEPIADAPAIGPLPCRSAGHVTFGCLNNPSKLNGAILGLWGRILQAVPGSRLALKFRRWFLTPELQARVTVALAARDIDPTRVEFLGGDDRRADHLEIYNRIDIALDTYPFAGSTTTFEALWMGVPVVTLMGGNMMSRWSGSMLKVLALDDLVTETPDSYVRTVAELAADHDRLASLRSGLRERILRSPLVDGRRRARQVERVYRAMWRRWCASEGTVGAAEG